MTDAHTLIVNAQILSKRLREYGGPNLYVNCDIHTFNEAVDYWFSVYSHSKTPCLKAYRELRKWVKEMFDDPRYHERVTHGPTRASEDRLYHAGIVFSVIESNDEG